MSLSLLAGAVLAPNLTDRLDTLLQDPALKGSVVAVQVEKPDGTVLYSQNAETRLMPASNQKILSVYYALSVLGPDHRPKTRFWKEGQDIIVHAEGDPLLTEAQLRQVRQQLKPTPQTRILVKQDFAPGHGFGWEHDDLPHAYASPITALTVDAGRFVVKAQNRIPVVPSYAGVTLRHRPSSGDPRLTFNLDRRLLTVAGTLPTTSDNVERFALPSPPNAAAAILGGRFYAVENVPAREPDAVIEGKSIGELAKLCLEPSDNAVAEHLLLLAALKEGPLGDNEFNVASQRMATFYQNAVGLPEGQIRPVDGSGLSRHNLVTAVGLARILRHAYATGLQNLFLEALPAPGEGTLRGRLNGKSVFAKTGTLSGASALSGYAMSPAGPLVFVVVMNHFIQPASRIRVIQDRIVEELLLSNEYVSYERNWCAPLEINLPHSSPLAAPRHWIP